MPRVVATTPSSMPTVARGKAERAGAIAGSAFGSSVTDYVTAEGGPCADSLTSTSKGIAALLQYV